MAEFPVFPIFTDAYLGDTHHLTTLEHGAYLLLLMTAWRSRDGSLPDDDKVLARCARLSAKQWARIRPTIQAFFVVKNGRFSQLRLTDERGMAKQRREKASNAGRASALKRLGRHSVLVEAELHPSSAQAELEGNPPLTNPYSVTNVTGETPLEIDPIKALFDAGIALLVGAGETEKKARSMIGKWRGQVGDDEVRLAIAEAQIARVSDPVPYLAKRFASKIHPGPANGKVSLLEYRIEEDRLKKEWESAQAEEAK